MSAIYHIIKPSDVTNGDTEATVDISAQSSLGYPAGYMRGYNDHVLPRDKGNPPDGSPLPAGNWRDGGKTIVTHIIAGGKGR